ncbi:MAG: thioredoxin family protein [Polyangiaceae bacterium]
MAGPEVIAVTPEELDARLAAREERLTVLYMWGPDCPNCVVFKRHLPALLEALRDADFSLLTIDVYAHPEVGQRYGVFGIPHFLLFKGGTKIGKMSEFRGERFWSSVVRENL